MLIPPPSKKCKLLSTTHASGKPVLDLHTLGHVSYLVMYHQDHSLHHYCYRYSLACKPLVLTSYEQMLPLARPLSTSTSQRQLGHLQGRLSLQLQSFSQFQLFASSVTAFTSTLPVSKGTIHVSIACCFYESNSLFQLLPRILELSPSISSSSVALSPSTSSVRKLLSIGNLWLGCIAEKKLAITANITNS